MSTFTRAPRSRFTAPYRALYEFRCASCGELGEKGSYACYEKGGPHHADCAGRTLSNRQLYSGHRDPDDEPTPEPTYVVSGIRPVPRCPQCHCEHRGDCW